MIIENLIQFHIDAEVTLVGSEISIEVFKYHPNISKTYTLDKKYSSIFLISRKIKKFDKFFSFRNSFRSNLFKLFIQSKEKFVYKKNNFKELHQVEKYTKFINNSLKHSSCINIPEHLLQSLFTRLSSSKHIIHSLFSVIKLIK